MRTHFYYSLMRTFPSMFTPLVYKWSYALLCFPIFDLLYLVEYPLYILVELCELSGQYHLVFPNCKSRLSWTSPSSQRTPNITLGRRYLCDTFLSTSHPYLYTACRGYSRSHFGDNPLPGLTSETTQYGQNLSLVAGLRSV